MRGKKLSEQEVAAGVVAWLQDMEWDVFEEVQVESFGRRADIIALRPPLVWAIEVKCSLSLRLFEQATHWLPYANYVSICTPRNLYAQERSFSHQVLEHFGLGYLSSDGRFVHTGIDPRLQRRPPLRDHLVGALVPEHKLYAKAGSMTGYFTPFQSTAKAVKDCVRGTPGLRLDELMRRIDHHYGSEKTARSAIPKWIEAGVIKGLRVERTGTGIRLWPEETGG